MQSHQLRRLSLPGVLAITVDRDGVGWLGRLPLGLLLLWLRRRVWGRLNRPHKLLRRPPKLTRRRLR